ncbi:hypothetical protein RA086_13090 [Lactiplantibacillus sp. WILCCON 0030]|uniref:Uncharacterized protein n=1 Tax=Lactiplantibacillus brownii TaxID=3069269 RepID=A0ABU1AC33_9LACO|nr:hypothetical protein [Lactiplantibacillus brownii]MDQ7938543.1 hypothetical protein [Lactiplantibacillus brownii]
MNSLIFQIIICLVLVLLGAYQINASTKYFRQLKLAGNATTSNFALLALWDGFIFGLIFILGGISMMLGLYA